MRLTTAPSGKFGAEPTSMMVLPFLLHRPNEHTRTQMGDSHCPAHALDVGLPSLLIDWHYV